MKNTKYLKPLISTIISFIVIIGFFSVFKGPNYVLYKYHYYNGYSKQISKDMAGAIVEYTAAINCDSSNFGAYVSRGSAYLDLRKYNEAIADYSTAIRLDSTNPKPFAYRGRAFYELSDITKALSDYDKSISLDDEFAYGYYNRGLLKFTLLADPTGGCQDLIMALDLGMDDAAQLIESAHCE